MIVVEEKVNEVFKQLPTILDNKPLYAWGDEMHLDTWVKRRTSHGAYNYPLIYQTSKKEKQNILSNEVETFWEAIVATQNTNTALLNDERWALSFRNELNPISENIVKGFELAGFTIVDGIVDTERYGNFGDGNKNFTIDIWDALTIKCKLIINTNCIATNLFS